MHGYCVFDLHVVRQVAAHQPCRRSPTGDDRSDAAQGTKLDSLAVAQLLHAVGVGDLGAVLVHRDGVGLPQTKSALIEILQSRSNRSAMTIEAYLSTSLTTTTPTSMLMSSSNTSCYRACVVPFVEGADFVLSPAIIAPTESGFVRPCTSKAFLTIGVHPMNVCVHALLRAVTLKTVILSRLKNKSESVPHGDVFCEKHRDEHQRFLFLWASVGHPNRYPQSS